MIIANIGGTIPSHATSIGGALMYRQIGNGNETPNKFTKNRKFLSYKQKHNYIKIVHYIINDKLAIVQNTSIINPPGPGNMNYDISHQ